MIKAIHSDVACSTEQSMSKISFIELLPKLDLEDLKNRPQEQMAPLW
jgi:hypothetical protein